MSDAVNAMPTREDHMEMSRRATRVRIYFGESDHFEGKPLYSALLELLRAEGASGATVLRGIAGFGAHSRIHTASIVDLSSDLPLVLEWVDDSDRVAALLPQIGAMVDGGMVTMEPVEILHYGPHEDKPR
jgi:PII-like signaling protein